MAYQVGLGLVRVGIWAMAPVCSVSFTGKVEFHLSGSLPVPAVLATMMTMTTTTESQ